MDDDDDEEDEDELRCRRNGFATRTSSTPEILARVRPVASATTRPLQTHRPAPEARACTTWRTSAADQSGGLDVVGGGDAVDEVDEAVEVDDAVEADGGELRRTGSAEAMSGGMREEGVWRTEREFGEQRGRRNRGDDGKIDR